MSDGGRALGTVGAADRAALVRDARGASPAGGAPLLVPMVRDAIRQIDVSARRIEVDGDFLDLPAGEGAEGADGA